MSATCTTDSQIYVRLRIKGKSVQADESGWTEASFLDNNELVALLRDRTGKSDLEIRDMLASYQTAKPAKSYLNGKASI